MDSPARQTYHTTASTSKAVSRRRQSDSIGVCPLVVACPQDAMSRACCVSVPGRALSSIKKHSLYTISIRRCVTATSAHRVVNLYCRNPRIVSNILVIRSKHNREHVAGSAPKFISRETPDVRIQYADTVADNQPPGHFTAQQITH